MDRPVMLFGEKPCLGYAVGYVCTLLDEGIHVLLTGGCRTHVGAISLAEAGTVETKVFPGHKDQVLSEKWARAIGEKTCQRTAIVCGVHYENATKEEIAEILATAEDLLEELLAKL